MRLVSYDAGDGARAGVLEDDRVVDAWAALGEPHRGSLRELIAHERVDDLRATLGNTGAPSHPLSAVAAAAADPGPGQDRLHRPQLRQARGRGRHGGRRPARRSSASTATRWRRHGATVKLPANSRKVDYEAEVAFVVGRRAKDVAETEALDHIAGYTLLNDLSARDLQFSTPQWMSGKVFDGSAPCGPALVTPDEAGPHDGIGIALTLNGEQMQGATTADLIFSIPQLLAHLSGLMTLEPGDIVSTGTPDGVGGARQPRVWLGDGDEISIASPTLGRLDTRIAV